MVYNYNNLDKKKNLWMNLYFYVHQVIQVKTFKIFHKNNLNVIYAIKTKNL